jgi:hypothetical protein
MRNGWVALVACCALLYGCATPWPQAVAVSDPAFAHRAQPITSIDILPVDLQLWTDDPDRGDPDQLRAAAESTLAGAITAALFQRGYQVRALVDWQGTYDVGGGHALAYTPDDLAATMDALSGYGTEASRQPGLPVPHLPAHLGDATHSDATLYVGGWAFVGDDTSTGTKVAEYIVIGIIVIAVVVIAIAAAKGSGGGGGHGGGVAHGTGTVNIGGVVRPGGFVHPGVSAGHVIVGGGGPVHGAAPRMIERPMRGGDAFGHLDVEVDDRPDWYEDSPHDGRSSMYVEMTLVDNHTGLVLWHARQRFPASAARSEDMQRVITSLIATLPASP